jgi:cytochrome c-type biogenesis protein
MTDISIPFAFLAGLVSFLSPCVLPIIPGFLAYLAGTSLVDAAKQRFEIFLNSLFFVIGFSTIFAALGVLLNTLLEHVAYGVTTWLSYIGGTIIIFFGLYLVGLIRVDFLEQEYKPQVTRKFNSRYATSFVFGAAFAAGWTPCVGAILGGILGLAASHPGSAFLLLLVYALGLGIPFLITGLFASQAHTIFIKYAYLVTYVNRVFGVFLIGIGILVFTQTLNMLANFEFINQFLLK